MATKRSSFYCLYGDRPVKRKDAPYPAGITQQHQKEMTDINYLMGRYVTHDGLYVGPINPKEPIYADLTATTLCDYRQNLDTVIKAQSDFSKLPAELRRHFSDSVADYLDAFALALTGEVDPMFYKFGIFEEPAATTLPDNAISPEPAV